MIASSTQVMIKMKILTMLKRIEILTREHPLVYLDVNTGKNRGLEIIFFIFLNFPGICITKLGNFN